MRFHARVLFAALLAWSLLIAAAQDSAAPTPIQREIISGSELMTARERERYRQRMRGAGTPERQAEVCDQHVKQMRERARLRGLALPDPQKPGTP